MSTAPKPLYTPDQYLTLERQAETKSEYFAGEIFAMAGATRERSLIVANLTRDLGVQMLDRPCEVYPTEMRVKVDETGLYTYPDLVVVCGEPRFEDAHVDTLLNPTLIIEVLSPSTEAYDRGRKFAQYRRLPSLREYLLIAQDQPRVEQYLRQPEGQWLLSEAETGTLSLPSIQAELSLAEIYRKITFPKAGGPAL